MRSERRRSNFMHMKKGNAKSRREEGTRCIFFLIGI